MLKIEKSPSFLCTVYMNENRREISTIAEPWENCEYVPALTREYTSQENYSFPVKFVNAPKYKSWSCHQAFAVVRTDVYPLWWIYVWLYLQVESLAYIAWVRFMWQCNKLGIAKTQPGFHFSWKDFLKN